jgi:hypothetical protein
VRSPQGTSAVEKRLVEVINIESGERHGITTNKAGGFTVKVKPGKYRVQVALLSGESVIEQPGLMDVGRSDVDAHADFVIGSVRLSRPRDPVYQPDSGLGAPIA